jgi:hypothetical protein
VGSAACPAAPGGAGGGALQLSARVAVHVSSTHALIYGLVNVGGGGGGRGCGGDTISGSGAGGGSGGALLVEAPTIDVSGILGASGGGGGGGGGVSGAAIATKKNGGDGHDGLDVNMAQQSSAGGAVSDALVTNAGGKGANSVVNTGGPDPGAMPNSSLNSAGGGGGAFGRIYVRSSGTPTLGTSSPTPLVFTGLPATIP